ncbi:MAG: hypothetical protein R3C03_21510 [Pirellulaceae bacterium]
MAFPDPDRQSRMFLHVENRYLNCQAEIGNADQIVEQFRRHRDDTLVVYGRKSGHAISRQNNFVVALFAAENWTDALKECDVLLEMLDDAELTESKRYDIVLGIKALILTELGQINEAVLIADKVFQSQKITPPWNSFMLYIRSQKAAQDGDLKKAITMTSGTFGFLVGNSKDYQVLLQRRIVAQIGNFLRELHIQNGDETAAAELESRMLQYERETSNQFDKD